VLIVCLGVVVAAVIVAIVVAVVPHATSVPPIQSASYKQSKAVPGFDESTHKVTEASQLTQLHDTLSKDGWTIGANPPRPQGCTGGLETSFSMTFTDGTSSSVSVYQCGNDNSALTDDLTKLVASWS
jgi:hypothetical protein